MEIVIRATVIGPATWTGSTPSLIRCHAAVNRAVITTIVATAQPNGSTRSTASGSGRSISRWMRRLISTMTSGGSSNGSPMYQERYAVCAHVGQSRVM